MTIAPLSASFNVSVSVRSVMLTAVSVERSFLVDLTRSLVSFSSLVIKPIAVAT